MPPHIVTAIQARKMVCNALHNHGYIRVSGGWGTSYFSKLGTHLKIRVSDHVDRGHNDDVCHDEVITDPTTMADIEHRAKRAHVAFGAATRNRKRKREAV